MREDLDVSQNMIARFQKWRFKKITKTVSLRLIEKFGKNNYYSDSELNEVIGVLRLSSKQQQYAYAMFADEVVCDGFLSRIGSSKTARELRYFLGGAMFGSGSSVSYDSSWNRFHDYDNEVLGGLQSIGGSSSFGSGASWGDGGGCGSGDGGGDGGGD